MPNRILKESICCSDDIDKLKPFEETVFYRLIVNVDDYGRIDARLSFLKSKLFVTKQGITERNIEDAILKLASIGLVNLYEVGGKPYLLFPKWGVHQQIRASRSKYPEPDNNGYQMISSDCKCPRNPIQSESNPKKRSLLSELPLAVADREPNLATPEKEAASGTMLDEIGRSAEREEVLEQQIEAESEAGKLKKGRKKARYEHDSPYYQSALWLARKIESRIPEYKKHTESQIQNWADSARLLLEADNRDKVLASKLLLFSQNDDFWKNNILSMPKFRQQFDKLLVRYQEFQMLRKKEQIQESPLDTGYIKLADLMDGG